jgi:hypothetical protein
MTRAYLLVPLAALAAGCYSSNPCYAPYLNVYWTPGAAPNGGFQVPGLPAPGLPAQLGCTDAGVDAVEVTVGGLFQPCEPGSCGTGANAGRWRCGVGGVSVPLNVGGTYDVTVDAFDSSGNLKYSSPVVAAGASDCNDSAVGIFSQGVAGTLGIDYLFVPAANCQAGSQIEWDLFSGTSTPFDSGSIACGTTNPFLVNGGFAVPAGVYTLDRVAEMVGVTSIHAFCGAPFPHAGPETLIVDMPASTGTCN